MNSAPRYCAALSTVVPNPPNPPLTLWPYQAKGNVPANQIPPGGFLEGGIDLAALDLENKCFASFLAESRSSGSATSAQLKDFVAHTFQPCVSGTVTTPSDATGVALATDSDSDGLKEVFPGAGVTDLAVVTGTGASLAPSARSVSLHLLAGPAQRPESDRQSGHLRRRRHFRQRGRPSLT